LNLCNETKPLTMFTARWR